LRVISAVPPIAGALPVPSNYWTWRKPFSAFAPGGVRHGLNFGGRAHTDALRGARFNEQQRVKGRQGGGVARSDLMKFWKLLADAKFTGRPSKLTEDAVRKMAKTVGLLEHEIVEVVHGFRVFKKQDG
jgi:hypothetical protein